MIPSEARGAWRQIESRLRPYVARRVASAADVDDVIQEVLVRLHRGGESLRDDERFGAWVYRVASRAIVDSQRQRMRHPLPRDGEVHEPVSAVRDAEGVERDGLVSELEECVALFVARLPSPYREAVILTELQGVRQVEAAAMLGISVSGMKSRVQRGREKIRALFEQSCEISLDGRGQVVDCTPRAADSRLEGRRVDVSRCGENQEGSCRR